METKTDVVATATQIIESLSIASGDPTIGAQQLLLLFTLYSHGEQAQNSLEKFTKVGSSANSRNIAKLGNGEWVAKNGQKVWVQGTGWIESYDDAMDRRNKMVRLTPKGHSVIRMAAQSSKQ